MKKVFLFDDVVVDGEDFRVRKSGKEANLTPRAFDVLLLLIRCRGRVVEKQEIFETVWKYTFVSDSALTKVVKEIRHALDDHAAAPRYIETVPKRGYRFIGEIREGGVSDQPEIQRDAPEHREEPSVHPRRWAWQPVLLFVCGFIGIAGFAAWLLMSGSEAVRPNSPIGSIAVLPFKPIDDGSRDEPLEMGMAESLIARLSNLKQVAVRPIGAVRKYSNLHEDPVRTGKDIGVDVVLDGSIQKSGDRIRVTALLVDVRTGTSLWSGQFDEAFTDIFGVQDSIAQRIAGALALPLSGQERELLAKHYTENPEAYQYYLRGQLTWHGRRQNWIEQSLAYYQKAIEADPNFALAYVGLADGYIMLNGHHRMSSQETETNAKAAITKALELDDTLAQAHNANAELKYQYEYDWAGAEAEFKKALELNPNVAWIHQAYGWFLMSASRFDEAAAEMETARRLDPSSLTINVGRGRLYYYSRQYDQAVQHFQNIIAVEPNDLSSYRALYTIYEQKRMYPEAFEALLMAQRRSETGDELREIFRISGWEGFLRHRLKKAEARAKSGDADPSELTELYVRLGEREKALFWLEKSFDTRDIAAIQVNIEPAFDSLRDDPRFIALIRRIGLRP